MARKSRKNIEPEIMVKSKLLQTAIYIRLSVEDNKKRGNSVETQTDILNDYIRNHQDLEIYDTYCDNGVTGRHFDRPEFTRMIDDIEKGNINCIVVKDLSRLGRNAIDTGYYVEKFFPVRNIRFISVVDNFDTETDLNSANGILLPLKNMINEAYSLDIGRKIKAQQKQSMLDGDFIGARSPYGYKKSPDNCHQLIIDEEAAEVVKLIFKMASERAGLSKICKYLNENNIMSPSFYMFDKGVINEKFIRGEGKWQTHSITRIIESETYIGNLVQGRSQSFNRVQKTTDKEDWVRVLNTHEPIISKELFEDVRRVREEMSVCYKGSWSENIFKGKIFCYDCGKNLHRQKPRRAKAPKGYIYIFRCISNNRIEKGYCTGSSIYEEYLINIVRDRLILHQDEVTKVYSKFEQKNKSDDIFAKNKKDLSEINIEIIKNKNYLKSLYENLVSKVITVDEYKEMKNNYEVKIANLSKEYLRIEEEQKELLTKISKFEETTSVLNIINKKTELTRDMVEKLIEKIVVRNKYNVEVFFKFATNEVANNE